MRQVAERHLSQKRIDYLAEALESFELGMADFMELDSVEAVEEEYPGVDIMGVDVATGGYEAVYHLVKEDLMGIEEEAEGVPADLVRVTSNETERIFEQGSAPARPRHLLVNPPFKLDKEILVPPSLIA
ncbi:hypothetical protein RUND412_011273 [Rhizina undulata]